MNGRGTYTAEVLARRERIATAAMVALLQTTLYPNPPDIIARAVQYADDLMHAMRVAPEYRP